ncbi:hypothetical protein VTN49DRAFT_162 [Thermomyces lanuginosus]|uniref:uncharacterized protein n=1 Tax=Thermomyces lanuginosus TaxID=5541 RepID=UPI003742D53B
MKAKDLSTEETRGNAAIRVQLSIRGELISIIAAQTSSAMDIIVENAKIPEKHRCTITRIHTTSIVQLSQEENRLA